MERILQIAYIGNGKSANRYHIPYVLCRKDRFRIKTIYNPRIHHDIWEKLPSVRYTDSIGDILKDDEVDLVVVSTAHTLHYQYAKRVLEAGKHVLVEKPFTMTSQEAVELFALAKEKNLYCSAYQNRRFDSDYLTVRKVIDSGKLGDLLELEMNFDYYRSEVPESCDHFDPAESFLYGHACHTLDQVIHLFGKPENTRFDVRQLLGTGRMNDYFDLDLYYGVLKVSIRSSFFRLKSRPGFALYGKRGVYIKETQDRQEEHLKLFYLPGRPGFGVDRPGQYGTLTYLDEQDLFHEEKVISEIGDYGRFYDELYESVVNGKKQLVRPKETILQMEMLERGIAGLR